MDNPSSYTAFAGNRRIVSGDLKAMLLETKALIDRGESDAILIFEDESGRQVDFDFRGTADEVIERAIPRPGPGRPRLGVVSREVTLLPRHWDWLEQQPSGISAALRRLVDDARKRKAGEEARRLAKQAVSRLMSALAGDRPGFEEASRALFADDRKRFAHLIGGWPKDVRQHLLQLTLAAF
jgi:hypothetical protein